MRVAKTNASRNQNLILNRRRIRSAPRLALLLSLVAGRACIRPGPARRGTPFNCKNKQQISMLFIGKNSTLHFFSKILKSVWWRARIRLTRRVGSAVVARTAVGVAVGLGRGVGIVLVVDPARETGSARRNQFQKGNLVYSSMVVSIAAVSSVWTKIRSYSCINRVKTNAGICSVGLNTIPRFRTVILLMCSNSLTLKEKKRRHQK